MTKTFVKNPFLALVSIIIVLVIGGVSLGNMQTDLMPDMELPYLAVIVTEPGASPAEVEKDVVEPLESALGTVSGVENVNSTSSNNYGMIMLEFAENTNMDSTLVRVSQQLNTVELPEGCGTPNLMEISMDMMATMYAAVDYEGKDIKELSTFNDKVLKPYLERQEGVASVTVNGAIEDTIEVRLDKKKIREVNKNILGETNEKLSDAQKKIDKGLRKVEDGKSELSKQEKNLSSKQDDTYSKLSKANVKLSQAQATKAAYEATLTSLKASQSALQGEKKAYKDAKIEENYKTINGMFATMNTTMKDAAKASGIEIPKSIEDAVKNPKKFTAFKDWMTKLGQGEQIKNLTTDSLNQMYQVVNVRLPQIDTELANLKTEIIAAEMVVKKINKQMKGMDKKQEDVVSGGYAASSGFGSGQAQISSAKTQLENAEKELDEAQKQLDESREAALDNANLDALLTLDTLSGLITAQNFAMPAGYIDDKKDNQWLVDIGTHYKSVSDLEQMVLTKIKGVGTIKLSDVADVITVDNLGDCYSKVNGEDSLMLGIYKGSTANTSTVSKNITDAFAELEKEYEGLSFTPMMNQGAFIGQVIDSVLSSILLGAVLAIIVLALFLKDIKPTIIVAVSIPFSVLFALIIMYFTDININAMSLAGLCMGIGMLVDNSIVVMENIYRLRQQGYRAAQAAVYGTKQVAIPILVSTLTTICVFLPMVFTSGMVSQMLIPFSFTISYALIASLVIALTVAPSLGSVLLKKTKEHKHPLFDAIKDIYGKILEFCLRFKVVPLAVAVVLLIICGRQVFSSSLTMMDQMESNQISATMEMKDGTSDEAAFQAADQAVDAMLKVDGVDKISVMDAGAMSPMAMSGAGNQADFSSFSFNIITDEEIKKTSEFERIIRELKESVKDVPCEEITVSSSQMGGMSDMMNSGMEVVISGDEQEKLIEISKDVMKIVDSVEGLENATNGLDENSRQVHLTFDKNKAARRGLSVAQIFQQLAGYITTEKDAITMDVNGTDMDVKIVDETEELTYENLMNAEITATTKNSSGEDEEKTYKLKDFAKKQDGYTTENITRENQTRFISVTAETVDDANTTLLSRKLQKKLDDYKTPEGYTIEISGETEQVNDMMVQMGSALLLGFLLIYLIMVVQFKSLLSPFIIIFTVPLAFTGGMLGLMAFDMSISAMSMMGFMVLMGTVVNNGIVFVDYANQLRLKGVEKKTALIITGKTRMRPIIMTALTTILSMSVMAFSQDAGNAMQKGMAVVVCFGLLYATLMTLFIVPVLYDVFYRRPLRNIDLGKETENIPDETEAVLEEYGYALDAAATAEEHA